MRADELMIGECRAGFQGSVAVNSKSTQSCRGR